MEFSRGYLGTKFVWCQLVLHLRFAIPGDFFLGIPSCFPLLGFNLIVRSRGTTFSTVGGLLLFSFLGELHPTRLKLHQEVGCPALAKHGYICQKDVTESEKVVDKFNNKFPNITDQSRTSKPLEKRVSEDLASDHVYDRRVHYLCSQTPHLTPGCHQPRLKRTLFFFQNKQHQYPPTTGMPISTPLTQKTTQCLRKWSVTIKL